MRPAVRFTARNCWRLFFPTGSLSAREISLGSGERAAGNIGNETTPGRETTERRRTLAGRLSGYHQRSLLVFAVVITVIAPYLAADFAARGCHRMNVHVGVSVAQRADEFFESGGGKLLCGQAYDVG